MNKLYSLLVIIAISTFGVAAAQAMPLAPLEQAQAGLETARGSEQRRC